MTTPTGGFQFGDDIQWRPVVGFEDYYLVSNDGQVLSLRKNRPIYQHTLNGGHKMVSLFRGDKGRKGHKKTVHTLVLEAFIGPSPAGMECLHENDVPDDNRLSNLRWGTRSENVLEMHRNGRYESLPSKLGGRCRNGHLLTENIFLDPPDSLGYRCKECRRAARREQYRKHKGGPVKAYTRWVEL